MENNIFKKYKRMKFKKRLASIGDDLVLAISILIAASITFHSMHSYFLKIKDLEARTCIEKHDVKRNVELTESVLLIERFDEISDFLEVEIDGEEFLIRCGIKDGVDFFDGMDRIKKLKQVKGISVEEIGVLQGRQTIKISIDLEM